VPTRLSSTPPAAERDESVGETLLESLKAGIRARMSFVDDVIALVESQLQLVGQILSTEALVKRLHERDAAQFAEQFAGEQREHQPWLADQIAKREQLRALLERIEVCPPTPEHQRVLALHLIDVQASSLDAYIAFWDAAMPIVPASVQPTVRAANCRARECQSQTRAWLRRATRRILTHRRSRSRARASHRRRSASSPPPALGDPDPEPPRAPGANAIDRAGQPVVVLEANDRTALAALASNLGALAADLWFDGKAGRP